MAVYFYWKFVIVFELKSGKALYLIWPSCIWTKPWVPVSYMGQIVCPVCDLL